MAKEPLIAEERAWDAASREVLKKAEKDGAVTVFHRSELQGLPCKFGTQGICCKNCHMGPCRISARAQLGICGADADTIVARNFMREVCSGTAAHSDHGRRLVLLLKKVAEGRGGDYRIKDSKALHRAAHLYHIAAGERGDSEIALELAELFLAEFTRQEEALQTLKLAPLPRQGVWEKQQVKPRGIDRMVVESMHRTHIGVDHDYKHILNQTLRLSLADGWGGSRIATMASDILFGTPMPVLSSANLGVLREDSVNIVVHGHEPALSEMLVVAASDPEMKRLASAAGAKGVHLAGICCTANEVLMRHGIPVAGNFLQQELAIITGAVEMMIVDVQCCMPSLPEVAAGYHTKVVSTSEIARTIGAEQITFDEDHSLEAAKNLVRMAVANFKMRDPAKLAVPAAHKPLVAGFSVEAIKYMLGGTFRASFRPLNDAIICGRIKGIAAVVGCSNPRVQVDAYVNILTRELIKRDVLVLETGCAAQACAKEGLLVPGTALAIAGRGLREVCEAVGIPPVLHMGSCVDNSRLLEAATELVREGGLGDDLGGLPVVGVAPEWMSEKAVAIGCYFVASGVDVILGQPFHISGSEKVSRYLKEEVRELFGGSFYDAAEPHEALEKIMQLLDAAREKLGINRKQERKLMDMKDRRSQDV